MAGIESNSQKLLEGKGGERFGKGAHAEASDKDVDFVSAVDTFRCLRTHAETNAQSKQGAE